MLGEVGGTVAAEPPVSAWNVPKAQRLSRLCFHGRTRMLLDWTVVLALLAFAPPYETPWGWWRPGPSA